MEYFKSSILHSNGISFSIVASFLLIKAISLSSFIFIIRDFPIPGISVNLSIFS